MRKILYFMIALTVLSFASCKDTEGSIGDPIISHGQDRDTDIITGDDYVYHLPVIFHVFYSNTTQYIEYTRLKEILSNVNELYQGDVYCNQIDTVPSENLHILFELAEKDESGKRLSTPSGIYQGFRTGVRLRELHEGQEVCTVLLGPEQLHQCDGICLQEDR